MADDLDHASRMQDETIAWALSAVDRTIPAGIVGDCEECGELMPRLVDGRCGFCRDGRKPTPEQYERARNLAEAMMTAANTTDSQTISVPVKGDTLAAIRAHASTHDLPMGRAVVSLVEQALAEPTEEATIIIKPASVAKLDTEALLAELGRRLAQAVTPQLLDAAITRAETAEGQLALVRNVLDQARPEGR